MSMNPPLTTAQQQTLKTAILAAPDLADLYNEGNLDGLAKALNQPESPPFFVWRSSVSLSEVTRRPTWDWLRVDNLSVAKARIWEWMFTPGSMVVPALWSFRSGVEGTFAVEASDAPNRQCFYDAGSKQASRVERLFVTPAQTAANGSTSGSTGDPSNNHGVGPQNMLTEGPITFQELMPLQSLP